jgi:hypothetical protein
MLNSHAVRAIKNRRSIIFHDTMYAKDAFESPRHVALVKKLEEELKALIKEHGEFSEKVTFKKREIARLKAPQISAKDGDGKQKLRGAYKGFNLIEYENQLIAATPSERTVATITGTSESDLYALKKKIDELNFAGDSKYAKDASIPDMRQKRILIDTIKNPAKGMFLGGPSFASAKEILMKKFGYTEQAIKNLTKDSDPRGYKVKDDGPIYIGNSGPLYKGDKVFNKKTGKKETIEYISSDQIGIGGKYYEPGSNMEAIFEVRDSDPRGYKVKDQIIKGFMIYKSGKPNTFTAKNESGEQYEGTMEQVKKQIDDYWAKRDEDVMKQKVNDHGYVVNRMGDYHIIEGAGVDGGWWFAKEVRGKGKLETKKFKTRAQAEEHARMSQPNLDEDVMKQKDGGPGSGIKGHTTAGKESEKSFRKRHAGFMENIISSHFPEKNKKDQHQKQGEMKQKVNDAIKIVSYKGYEIIKNDNDDKFRVFLSGFEVFVPQKSLEAAKALIDKKNSKAKDSKTKDKSPRWRIKDDKMFKLKTAAKKMKDSKVNDDVMYQGQSYPVKELHRILANKGKVKEFNELSEKEQKERMGNPFALYESGDNIYAVVRRNKVN